MQYPPDQEQAFQWPDSPADPVEEPEKVPSPKDRPPRKRGRKSVRERIGKEMADLIAGTAIPAMTVCLLRKNNLLGAMDDPHMDILINFLAGICQSKEIIRSLLMPYPREEREEMCARAGLNKLENWIFSRLKDSATYNPVSPRVSANELVREIKHFMAIPDTPDLRATIRRVRRKVVNERNYIIRLNVSPADFGDVEED